MLITERYRELNAELHADPDMHFGERGSKWAHMVSTLADAMKTTDVLDYGCGKQSLQKELPYVIGYDPCIPGLDDRPSPSDLVVCTDVLEHIEPECLNDVLADLVRVTGSTLFAVVATRPAKKHLSDGRNAHLIIEQPQWWMRRFFDRFHVQQFQDMEGEFIVIANSLPS